MKNIVEDGLWAILAMFVIVAIAVARMGGDPTALIDSFRVVFTMAVFVGIALIAVSKFA